MMSLAVVSQQPPAMRPSEQGVAIYWYEEESIYDEETIEDDTSTMIEDDALYESTDEEEEYTEVTYESEEVAPQQDDILLGVLPPAPPLLGGGSVYSHRTDKSSEVRLLEAMRKKRQDNTTLQKGEPLEDAGLVRHATEAAVSKKNHKNSQPPPHRPKPLHHHSPTGVLDFPVATQLEPQEEETQTQKEPVRVVRTRTPRTTITSPRVAALDRILFQQEERRAFTVPSADPHYQNSSLQKFWKEMILYEMAAMERQLTALAKKMNYVENQVQTQRQPTSSP
jgi:hypothetical protein